MINPTELKSIIEVATRTNRLEYLPEFAML